MANPALQGNQVQNLNKLVKGGGYSDILILTYPDILVRPALFLCWKRRLSVQKHPQIFMGTSNMGVCKENMGVFNEIMRSPLKIWGFSIKIWGLQQKNGISIEVLGKAIKIWGSPTKIWGLHWKFWVCAGCVEKIGVEKAVFWSTDRDQLTRIKNYLSKISTPCITFLILFVIIIAEFWQYVSSEF